MISIGQGIRRLSATALLLGVVGGVTACDLDKVLDVEDRDTVNPTTLEDPGALQIVVNGALGDFEDGYASDDDYLIVSALISDEFISAGTFTTRTATDRRNQFQPDDGNTSDQPYVNLHQARRSLKAAAAKVAEFEGTSDARYALMKALEGYTYVMLGEGWCPAVPLSTVEPTGERVLDGPNSGVELFNAAITAFDDALSASPGYELALVGKGRAQVNLGQFSAAASTVAPVGDEYNYLFYHSTSGITNPVYGLQQNGRYSVADNEGQNGLPFISADDPRVPISDGGPGFDPSIQVWLADKYPSVTASTPLASGIEARLIEAEAALQADDYAAMTGVLNDLRQDVATLMAGQVAGYATIVPDATLPDLAVPTTEAEAVDMLFYERGFWLFLTGHRLGDMRRLVVQYNRAESETYPTGEYHKGGTYGDDAVFPLDFDETNNTTFVEAGGLSLCDVDGPAFQ